MSNAAFKTTHRIAGFAAALLSTAIAAPQSYAQQSLMEEIVVTARKREENLQVIPISIQAFSDVELRRSNTIELDDLAQGTLGLSFQDVNGAFQNPSIRGLAQTDTQSLEGNVGVFLDGVFLDNRSGLEFGNMELERIEVVKGPQSALYGRNTFAGAINYVTKAPNLTDFEGKVEGTLGDHGRWTARGSVNLPLVADKLAIRAFGGASEFGGTIRNQRNGERLGGYRDRDTFGGQVLFKPAENVEMKVFAARNKRDDEQPPFSVFYYNQINNCGASFNVNPVRNAPPILVRSLYCGDAPDVRSVTMDPRGRGNTGKVDLIYGTVSAEFSALTATAQASHTKSEFGTFVDQAGDPTAFTRVLTGNFSQQFFTNSASDVGKADSYELRLQSNEDAELRWLIGGSYFDTLGGTVLASQATPVNGQSPLNPITRVERRLNSKEKAIFGSVGYELSEGLNVSAELRYTDIDQVFTGQTIILFLPLPPTIVPRNVQGFNTWTPRFTVDYRINDEMMVYANVGRGWKAGGFNPQAAPFDKFEPESNWSYEVGAKSTLMDGRLLLNAAAYYIDWNNLQINQTINALGSLAITNIGGATSKGVEVQAQAAVTDQLTISGGLTLLDPSFKKGTTDASLFAICGLRPDSGIVGPPCSIDVSGKRIQRVSSRQGFVNATYTVPDLVAGLDGYIRADFSHQNGKYMNSLNTGNAGAINLTNLRIGVSDDKTDIAFWVDNLFDKAWVRNLTPVTSPVANNLCLPRGQNCSVQDLRVYQGERMTLGITASRKF